MGGLFDKSCSCDVRVVVGGFPINTLVVLNRRGSGCLSWSLCSRAQFLLFRAEMESSYLDLVPESLIEIMTCGVL